MLAQDEFVQILVPGIKYQLELEFIRPEGLKGKARAEDLEPILKRVDFNAQGITNNEALSQFVFYGDSVFDMSSLVSVPLKLQVKVEEQLRVIHPELAKKIYIHNSAF